MSNDVGGDENFGFIIFEVVKDSIMFLGEFVIVERGNGMIFGNKMFSNVVGGDFLL